MAASTQAVTPSGVADSSTTTLSMMMFCLSGSAPAAQEPAALSAAMQHSARDILRIGALPYAAIGANFMRHKSVLLAAASIVRPLTRKNQGVPRMFG